MDSNSNQDPGESPWHFPSNFSSPYQSTKSQKRKHSDEEGSSPSEAPPKKHKGKEKDEVPTFSTEIEISNRRLEATKPKRGRPPKNPNSKKKEDVFSKYNLQPPNGAGIASSSNTQAMPPAPTNLLYTPTTSRHRQGQMPSPISLPLPPLSSLWGPVTVRQAQQGMQPSSARQYPQGIMQSNLISAHGGTGSVSANPSSFNTFNWQEQLNVAGPSMQQVQSQLMPQGVTAGGQFYHNQSMMHGATPHGPTPMNRAGHDGRNYVSGPAGGVPTTTTQMRSLTPATYQLRNHLMPPSAPRMSRSNSDTVTGIYAPTPQQPPINRRFPSGLGNVINMQPQQNHYTQPYLQVPGPHMSGPERRQNQSCPPPDQGYIYQPPMNGYVAPINTGVEFSEQQLQPFDVNPSAHHLPSVENVDYSQHGYLSSTGMPFNNTQPYLAMNPPLAPSNVQWSTTGADGSSSRGYPAPAMHPEPGPVGPQYHPDGYHHQLSPYESFSQQAPLDNMPTLAATAVQAPVAHPQPSVQAHFWELENPSANHYYHGSLRNEYTSTVPVSASTSAPSVKNEELEMLLVDPADFELEYVDPPQPLFDFSDTNAAAAVDETLSLPVPEVEPFVERQEELAQTAHEEEREVEAQPTQDPATTVLADDQVDSEALQHIEIVSEQEELARTADEGEREAQVQRSEEPAVVVGSPSHVQDFDEGEPTDLEKELFGDLDQDELEEGEIGETEVSRAVLPPVEVTSESLPASAQVPTEIISSCPQTGGAATSTIVIEDGDEAGDKLEDAAPDGVLAAVVRADSSNFDDWLLKGMLDDADEWHSSDDWLLRDLQKEENGEINADHEGVVESAKDTSKKGAMKSTEEHVDVDWLAEAMAQPSSPVVPAHKPEREPEHKPDSERLYPLLSPTASRRSEPGVASASTAMDLGGSGRACEAPLVPSEHVEDHDDLYDSDFSSSDDSFSS